MITKEAIEAAALSDAAFDGRRFDGLSAADKRRYRERSAAAITAAFAAMPGPAVKVKEVSPETHLVGWAKVPDEPTLELLKSINADNQALAYENGRYYNAWFEFEPSEGGWFWTDDADSEPNPTHYRLLSEVALAPEGQG